MNLKTLLIYKLLNLQETNFNSVEAASKKFLYKSNFKVSPSKVNINKKNKKFKILSLDGGGIRGLSTMMILDYIEKKTGKPISQLFDLIVGTSTGAIGGALLTIPDEYNKPKFTAEQSVNLYNELGPSMFKSDFWSLKGYWSPKYSKSSKREVLLKYVFNLRLSSLLKNMTITSFDYRSMSPYFFKTTCAKHNANCNYDLVDVLDATSSAPSYYAPTKVIGMDSTKDNQYRSFLDGGLVANSPEMVAINNAKHDFKIKDEDILMVSIGTGHVDYGKEHHEVKDWGKLFWASNIADILIEASSSLDNSLTQDILKPDQYFRFQFEIEKDHKNLDDSSLKNMSYLRDKSIDFIKNNIDALDKACDSIINSS